MKRILLYTRTLIWWLSGDEQLGLVSRSYIEDADNDIYVSAATTWEMSIKRQLGKLEAPRDIDAILEREGFTKLLISVFHGEQAGDLPLHHKDPFDRMLIAQAQAEGLQILTKDEHFSAYGINVLDATK